MLGFKAQPKTFEKDSKGIDYHGIPRPLVIGGFSELGYITNQATQWVFISGH